MSDIGLGAHTGLLRPHVNFIPLQRSSKVPGTGSGDLDFDTGFWEHSSALYRIFFYMPDTDTCWVFL
jgi:hypothetical protein